MKSFLNTKQYKRTPFASNTFNLPEYSFLMRLRVRAVFTIHPSTQKNNFEIPKRPILAIESNVEARFCYTNKHKSHPFVCSHKCNLFIDPFIQPHKNKFLWFKKRPILAHECIILKHVSDTPINISKNNGTGV